MLELFLNTVTRRWYDKDGDPFGDGMPRGAYLSREDVKITLCRETPNAGAAGVDVSTWTRDASLASVSGVGAMLTIDSDRIHKLKGVLSSEVSAGAVSTITATIENASNATVPESGTLRLFDETGDYEAIAYTDRSIIDGEATFTVSGSVSGSYAVGSVIDCDQSPYAQAYLDTSASNLEQGELVFHLVIDSQRLRDEMDYSDVATLSIAGLELLIYRTADGASDPITAYLCETYSVTGTLGSVGNESQPPDATADKLAGLVDQLLAAGLDVEQQYDSEGNTQFRVRSVSAGGTWSDWITVQKGDKGDKGDDGESFSVDATGTLSERSQYDAESAGFSFLATDEGNLYIKNSDTSGDWSDAIPFQGPAGEDGAPGPANTLTIGTVTTGEPGTQASASITGDSPNQVLNLTIPRGDKGEDGSGSGSGDMLKSVYDTNNDGKVDAADEADSALNVGGKTAEQVATAVDNSHTHSNKTTLDKLGESSGKLTFDGEEVGGGTAASVAWDDVTGKPSDFPPADHSHEISDVNGLQTALDGKGTVKTVNGVEPDSSGNVTIETGGGGTVDLSGAVRRYPATVDAETGVVSVTDGTPVEDVRIGDEIVTPDGVYKKTADSITTGSPADGTRIEVSGITSPAEANGAYILTETVNVWKHESADYWISQWSGSYWLIANSSSPSNPGMSIFYASGSSSSMPWEMTYWSSMGSGSGSPVLENASTEQIVTDTISLFEYASLADDVTRLGNAVNQAGGLLQIDPETNAIPSEYLDQSRLLPAAAQNNQTVIKRIIGDATRLLLHFDETGGSSPADSSVSNAVVDARTTTANGDGKFSACRAFNGSYLQITSPVFDTGDGDFTYDAWFKFSVLNRRRGLFGTEMAIYVAVWEDNSLGVGMSTNGSSWTYNHLDSNRSSAKISQNEWIHIALVRYNGTLSLYLNGENILSFTVSGNIATRIGTDAFSIGLPLRGMNSSNDYVDEFRFSNIARWVTDFTPPTAPYSGSDEYWEAIGLDELSDELGVDAKISTHNSALNAHPMQFSGETDFNNLTQGGSFYLSAGDSLQNAPATGTFFVIIKNWTSGDITRIFQQVYRLQPDGVHRFYTRHGNKASGAAEITWSSWMMIGYNAFISAPNYGAGVNIVSSATSASGYTCTSAGWIMCYTTQSGVTVTINGNTINNISNTRVFLPVASGDVFKVSTDTTWTSGEITFYPNR